MPAADVTVTPQFEPLYNILPDNGSPTECQAADAHGNKVCPIADLFARDTVLLKDFIKPATGYEIDQLTIEYFDGSEWKQITVPSDTITGSTLQDSLFMPTGNIRVRATFKPGFTIQVYYTYKDDAASPTDVQHHLTGVPEGLPGWAPVDIPISPKAGYSKYISITARNADNDEDISNKVDFDAHTITMPNPGCNINVYVTFVIDTLTLQYTATEGGTLSGEATQKVTYGSDGSPVTAVANSNYRFMGWNDGGNEASRTETNVTANQTYEAQFAQEFSITSPDGSVTPQPAKAIAGERVLLTANTPDCQVYEGSITATAGTISKGTPGTSPDTLIMPAQDVDVTADFEPTPQFAIGLKVHAPGGTPNKNACVIEGLGGPYGIHDYYSKFDCGTIVTLTCIPNEGYRFVGWYKNGFLPSSSPISTEKEYSFTINSSSTYVAVLEKPIEEHYSETACGSYTWYGNMLNTSGSYKKICLA